MVPVEAPAFTVTTSEEFAPAGGDIRQILEANSLKEEMFMPMQMLEITVTKEKLLAKLKENRAKHAKVYEEAVEGYHDAALTRLEEEKARLLARKHPENIVIHLPMPEDHTKDYDRLIAMIDISEDTEFDLTEQQAANYIMDEWHWTHHWLANNAAYSATAAIMTTERG